MKAHEIISAGYTSVLRALEGTLTGLEEEELNWQPSHDTNSIGWLVWHLTRVQDALIGRMAGEEQLWAKDGWHKKFGRAADEKDVGAGHTPDEVATFQSPDAETMLGYQRAVLERSQRYFATLSEADLEKPIDDPRFKPTPKVGEFLMMILADGLQHAGQAAYVRGLNQGKGWLKI
jgi:uncharacterized damage-inducible protein DinB